MFKIGDKVRHKSGGPVMIVVSWTQFDDDPGPLYGCTYFRNVSENFHTTQFSEYELVKVEDQEPSADVDKEYTRIVEEQYTKRAEKKDIARKAEEAPVINRDLENWLDWLRKEYESKEKEYKFPDCPVVPKPYYWNWPVHEPYWNTVYCSQPYTYSGVDPYASTPRRGEVSKANGQASDTPTWLKVK